MTRLNRVRTRVRPNPLALRAGRHIARKELKRVLEDPALPGFLILLGTIPLVLPSRNTTFGIPSHR